MMRFSFVAVVLCSVLVPGLGVQRMNELNGMFRIEHRSGRIFDIHRICDMLCNKTSHDYDYDFWRSEDPIPVQPRIFCALCKKKGSTESTTTGSSSTTPMSSTSSSSSSASTNPTIAPTTAAPITAPTTAAPTIAPTTAAPTTAPTTAAPTTAPTTAAPTTAPTTTPPSS